MGLGCIRVKGSSTATSLKEDPDPVRLKVSLRLEDSMPYQSEAWGAVYGWRR